MPDYGVADIRPVLDSWAAFFAGLVIPALPWRDFGASPQAMPIEPLWSYSRRVPGGTAYTLATSDEAARIGRLVDPEKAQDLLHARHLMRELVAGHAGLEAGSVSLKVFDDAPPKAEGMEGLAISWSRSGPHALAALLPSGRIGADIEQVKPVNTKAMLDMIALPHEREAIGAGSEADALLSFYRLWCAKEAVLKWRGTGLRGGAKTVSVPADFITGAADAADLVEAGMRVRLRIMAAAPDCVAVIAFSK